MSTTTVPKPIIGFTPPDGCRDYATVTVWPTSTATYLALRSRAVRFGHSVEDHHQFNSLDGKPFHTCSWSEGLVHVSMHAPDGPEASGEILTGTER